MTSEAVFVVFPSVEALQQAVQHIMWSTGWREMEERVSSLLMFLYATATVDTLKLCPISLAGFEYGKVTIYTR